MSIAGLTKIEVAEVCETIWDKLCSGSTDQMIMDDLSLDPTAYHQLRRRMFDNKSESLAATPPEHVYVQYVINQSRNIADLNVMLAQWKDSKQYNAFVGAIKLRADLYDRLIDKGQEFGLIRPTAEPREIIHGMIVAEMTHKELKKALISVIKDVAKMMRAHGDHDIIDATPGPIHHGPSLPPPKPGELDGEEPGVIRAPRSKPSSLGKKKKKGRRKAPSKTVRARTSKTSKAARGRKPFPRKG